MVSVCVRGVVVLNPGRWLRATASWGAQGDVIGRRRKLHLSWAGGVRRPLWTRSQVLHPESREREELQLQRGS